LSVGKMSAQATDPMTWQPVPTETNSILETSPEIAEEKTPVKKAVSEIKEVVAPGFRKIRIRLKVKYGSKTLSSEYLEGICQQTSEAFTLDKNGFGTLTVPDSTEEYTLTILLKPRGFRGFRTQMLTIIPDKQNYKVKRHVFVNQRVYSRGFMVRDYRYSRPSTWQKIKNFLNLEPPRYGR
ncbi:MAG TPA: hypothetical protein PLK63_09475, partial [Catalimonadaceae bacterium]|nr:hypothetical protein [Catalimonadaceae bacterium]